jgi:hypothetical protein
MGLHRALANGIEDPSLHDENWRFFILDKEANSVLATEDWRRYRQGLRRLARKYLGRVPRAPLQRALAEDAFSCATQWKKSPRIVRRTLHHLLKHSLGLNRYTFAATEYWKWASAVSSADLLEAEHMIAQARDAMRATDALTRGNLNRMLESEMSGHRPRPPEPPPPKLSRRLAKGPRHSG